MKNVFEYMKRFLVILSIFVVISYFSGAFVKKDQINYTDYSRFINEVNEGSVDNIVLDAVNLAVYEGKITEKSGDIYFVTIPVSDKKLFDDLLDNNVKITVIPPPKSSFIVSILLSLAPILLLIGVILYVSNKQSGGAIFGKSKAKLLRADTNKTSFANVAGCTEAKEEVKEIVEFLKNPQKFTKLGGKIPKGALMVGPPGTGKTMLARAIASEANVPFYTISGSDFVEMFVGVGASRVRNMFEEAIKTAPCIIFIDEIDAVGKARNGGAIGNDEREQTLNALLTEMDGFHNETGVIVIAATNRPEVLDQALLRPGRFDRQIIVGLPDVNERKEILLVHAKGIPGLDKVDFDNIARGTPGFSGADLASLINESSIFAARDDSEIVTIQHIEKAKDKILMGVEKKSNIMSEDEKRMTAYHEAGHVVVGYLVPEHDPVYKVSIIPRGKALGITMYLPDKDTVSMSKTKLESMISSLYGGRIAEILYKNRSSMTTGASNDIERATSLATKMITEWGMSNNLVPMKYIDDGDAFGGSPKIKVGFDDAIIYDEIKNVLNRCYLHSEKVLKDNWDKVIALAELLMEKETVNSDEIEAIMKG